MSNVNWITVTIKVTLTGLVKKNDANSVSVIKVITGIGLSLQQ